MVWSVKLDENGDLGFGIWDLGFGTWDLGLTGDSSVLEIPSWFTLWRSLISLSKVSLFFRRRKGQLSYFDGSF